MIAHRYYLQHTCYQMSYIQNNFKQVDKKRKQKRWWIRRNQSQGQSEETPGADGTQEYLQSHLESQPKLKADSDDKNNRGPADQPRLTTRHTRLCMLWLLRYSFTAVCGISLICLRPYLELVQKLFTTVRCICDDFLPVFFLRYFYSSRIDSMWYSRAGLNSKMWPKKNEFIVANFRFF